MKNSILVLIFTVFVSLLLAQSGSTILMNSFCVSEDFTLSYASASGSPSRNVYEGIGNSFNPVRVLWSTDNNRWEIWTALDSEPVVFDILLYSNTFASVPNPPDRDTGTWVNEADCTDPLVTFSGDGTQSFPMAVELLSFTGKSNDLGNILTWLTVSEQNNSGFHIERSSDGKDWQSLAFQVGKGTTTEEQLYLYTDEHPLPSINYYRLQQVDFDGRFEYSKVVCIKLDAKDGEVGSFYPNPSKSGMVNLVYATQFDDEISISVFDMTGRLVMNQIQQVSSEDNNLSFDFSDLTKGIYVVKITDEINKTQRKLIIE